MSKTYQKTSYQSIENSLASSVDMFVKNLSDFDKQNPSEIVSEISSNHSQKTPYFLIQGNKASTPTNSNSYEPDFCLSENDLYDLSEVQTIPFQGLLPVSLDHQKRLDKYADAHKRAVSMSLWIRQNQSNKDNIIIASALKDCGNYLIFRNYFTRGEIRLHGMCSCKKHILCPLCAIRRGAKSVEAYMQKLEQIKKDHPNIRASLVTLTVKNGSDLRERFNHLHRSVKKMTDHRRKAFSDSSRNLPIEANKVLGAVWSFEFKIGSGSGLWHPHCHAIWLHYDDLDQDHLSREWFSFTGDSHVVNITPFHDQENVASGFLEVFKYALKFSTLTHEQNWHGYEVLNSRRLVASFGLFRGVQVPESLTDEPIDSIPYVELFYRYFNGSYHLKHKHFELGNPLPF